MWINPSWSSRQAITVDNSAGSAGAGKDVRLIVPSNWDFFWSNVLSTGFDVRITASDGVTAVSFQRATWTFATKTATLEVDAWTAPAAQPCVLWLYWGNSSAADTAGTGLTIATPLTGYCELLRPGGAYKIRYKQDNYGDTAPVQRIQKGSTEAIDVWVDFSAGLEKRVDPQNNSRLGQEIDYVSVVVTDAGASQASMVDATAHRVTEGIVKCRLLAGASGGVYLATVTVVTTGDTHSAAATLIQRFLVAVQNTSD